MKQINLNFNVNKKTKIYGVLDLPNKKTKSIIIFVHGMAGHMNEHQFFNAAKFFTRKGFAVYRFNLYDWRKKSRRFRDFTLAQGAADLNFVINKIKAKGFKKIGLVGHSYGGPTILMADLNKINAIVFWDPSFKDLRYILTRDDFKKVCNLTIANWGVEFIVGKKMINEAGKLKSSLKSKLIKSKIPFMIIVAEKGMLAKKCKEWYGSVKSNVQKSFVLLKNSGHTFDELGAEDGLFKHTYRWFNKYLK